MCPDACRKLETGITAVYDLTLGDHFAKHRHVLQSGAVPSTVAKLELTLVYSQLGSTTHRIHHLHTALTDLDLQQRHTGATSATNTAHILIKYFTFSFNVNVSWKKTQHLPVFILVLICHYQINCGTFLWIHESMLEKTANFLSQQGLILFVLS